MRPEDQRSARRKGPSPGLADQSRQAGLIEQVRQQTHPSVLAGLIPQHALRLLPGGQSASLSRHSGQASVVLACTSALARTLDASQARLQEGPCAECLPAPGQRTAVKGWWRSDDLAADPRWPHWAPLAVVKGERSLLCVAIPAAGMPAMTVSVYSPQPGVFRDRRSVDALMGYADAVAPMVHAACGSLDPGLDPESEIGVAQGILMARHDLSFEQAQAALERIASASGIDIHQIARDVQSDTLPVGAATHILFARLRH